MANEPKIILAKTAGFCFGVTKAVDKVYELASESGTPIYTFGPIIHNEEVVKDLEAHGVKAVDLDDALKLNAGDTIVIRSHGVRKEEEDALVAHGLNVVDATCPFVKKIHKIVEEAVVNGETVIIIGDKTHPEVQGILSRSGDDAIVIGSEKEAENLPKLDRVKVVSQTTFNHEKFQKIVDKIGVFCYDLSVMNTICNATQERQTEARQIASSAEAMVVIGGKHSSNTQKLFDICKSVCDKTYFVQTVADMEAIDFPTVQSVGVTAGASTPGNIIQEVLNYVRTRTKL